jgi:peptidoglycan-associated lipoprotein
VSILRLATTLAALISIGVGIACNEPKGPTPQQIEDIRRAEEEAARLAAERAAAEASAREEAARRAEEAARRAEEARLAHEALVQASLGVLIDVNFDYNRADVRRADRIKLEAIAEFMKSNPQASVLIEGHCDERGTIEYNFALGERRAFAVRSYLVGLGANESNFRTVSFGKERPKIDGHGEKSWFANRRCEFKLQ